MTTSGCMDSYCVVIAV